MAAYQKRRADGYMSGLEAALGGQLDLAGVEYEYEALVIPYTQPAKPRRYTPDFVLPNGIIVEVKGRFQTADRQKHLHIAECWPLLEIRFVFSNSKSRISKQSKTTYGDWCQAKGFPYADRIIPLRWLREEISPGARRALEEIRNHRYNSR